MMRWQRLANDCKGEADRLKSAPQTPAPQTSDFCVCDSQAARRRRGRLEEWRSGRRLGRRRARPPAELRSRLAERRITLDVTDSALARIAAEGFDPAYGARPLKRVIQREIGDRIAVMILEGAAVEGATITVDGGEGSLAIRAA